MSNTMDMQGNIYKGRMIMENVEVRNCSQRGTGRAAIRFDQGTGYSRIKGSSIHSGLGHGMSLTNFENVEILNSAIVGFQQVGFKMDYVKNVTVDGLFVSGIRRNE